MKNLRTPAFIFSVHQPELGLLNADNRQKIEALMTERGVQYKVLHGTYKGKQEISYIVSARHEDFVLSTMRVFNQESVLRQYADGSAFLVYADGREEFLGEMHEVSRVEAWSSDSYSFDPARGMYFVARRQA